MITIGIDPGKDGGIAAIGPFSEVVAFRMPATETDLWALIKQWTGLKTAHVFLERAQSFPKQGIASAFNYGTGYGNLRMALIAAGIPFEVVSSGIWQGKLHCRTKGDKNVSKRKAQELFPQVDRITHATADALLIAEYGRRIRMERGDHQAAEVADA